MGSFSFEFQGWAKVSRDYHEASTGGSGNGNSTNQYALERLAESVPIAADRSASHAGDMVVRLREHADRSSD
jgi:pectate lyase